MKIVISGTTGVGKSTIVNKLKKHFEDKGKKVYLLGEMVVDSPYFDLYFNNNVEWGIIAQLDFLFERFQQYVDFEIKYQNRKSDFIVIYDRHFLEDKIFSELSLIKKNNSVFLRNAYSVIFDELVKKIESFEKPDFLILLKASFDVVKERMKKRNRDIEFNFDTKYWQDLYYRYYGKASHRERFIKYSLNFVEMDANDNNPDEVLKKIIKYIENKTNIKNK